MGSRLETARRHGDRAGARDLERQRRALPAGDPMDPGYRRLRYIRYAGDRLLGFTGPKAEAEDIKAKLTAFLRETLGLELNQDKTLITHARTGRGLAHHPEVVAELVGDRGDGAEHQAGRLQDLARLGGAVTGQVRTAVSGTTWTAKLAPAPAATCMAPVSPVT